MKKLLIALLAFSLCYLSGCYDDAILRQNADGKELCAEIIQCIKEADISGIEALFCEEVSDTHDLDTEIELAFGFIEGEILSHDNFSIGSGDSTRDGKTVKSYVIPVIDNIKTDTGNSYTITFLSYLVLDDNDRMIGINYITIRNQYDETITIGEYLY